MGANDGAVRPELDRKARETYPVWTFHTIRYNDTDSLGHVNNAVYSTFFEAGRTAMVVPMLEEFKDEAPHLDFVLARIIIDFHKELRYPGGVDIGSRVLRLGTKSMTFLNGVFRSETDECVASCEAILVFFDLEKRRSVEPPERLREMIAQYL